MYNITVQENKNIFSYVVSNLILFSWWTCKTSVLTYALVFLPIHTLVLTVCCIHKSSWVLLRSCNPSHEKPTLWLLGNWVPANLHNFSIPANTMCKSEIHIKTSNCKQWTVAANVSAWASSIMHILIWTKWNKTQGWRWNVGRQRHLGNSRLTGNTRKMEPWKKRSTVVLQVTAAPWCWKRGDHDKATVSTLRLFQGTCWIHCWAKYCRCVAISAFQGRAG